MADMETVNIKKLAQMLNLSISTISKALRDSYDISQETKDKVIQLARELNYQPNLHASSLRKNKSKTIAVIVPEIANNYFALAINGIESIAEEKGYHVLIYLTHEDAVKEIKYTRHLHSGRVDGVLISLSSTTTDYSHLYELQEKKIPIIFFDRVCEDFNTIKVTTDDIASSRLATQHLIDKGCKKIAHLAISGHLSIGQKRLAGYRQALSENGLPFKDSQVVECTNDNGRDFELIRELMLRENCDGLFAAVERYAISAYDVCQHLQLAIPKQVKIIGFSNLQTAALLNPSLTTITQPAFDIGKEAASLLFRALEKKSFLLTDEKIIFQSILMERESTRS